MQEKDHGPPRRRAARHGKSPAACGPPRTPTGGQGRAKGVTLGPTSICARNEPRRPGRRRPAPSREGFPAQGPGGVGRRKWRRAERLWAGAAPHALPWLAASVRRRPEDRRAPLAARARREAARSSGSLSGSSAWGVARRRPGARPPHRGTERPHHASRRAGSLEQGRPRRAGPRRNDPGRPLSNGASGRRQNPLRTDALLAWTDFAWPGFQPGGLPKDRGRGPSSVAAARCTAPGRPTLPRPPAPRASLAPPPGARRPIRAPRT
uniref:zinc finger and BTB domain-containing protein 21 isoform X3 n=1 Tax=Callithrix jacchus TaxID=9483 RepID=UPI0023DD5A38|nr:zinc finger and BTB domain-containing protein 21 isoform X3 [Callithrix jacchus]